MSSGVSERLGRLGSSGGSEALSRFLRGTDATSTNDYDDIAALRIRATVQSERTDPRVNGGHPVQRLLQ